MKKNELLRDMGNGLRVDCDANIREGGFKGSLSLEFVKNISKVFVTIVLIGITYFVMINLSEL